jgi:hypothetical protein
VVGPEKQIPVVEAEVVVAQMEDNLLVLAAAVLAHMLTALLPLQHLHTLTLLAQEALGVITEQLVVARVALA